MYTIYDRCRVWLMGYTESEEIMTKINFNLKMDLYNHTTWSDGDDKPEDIIKNAIDIK